jgi:hypothetical protein
MGIAAGDHQNLAVGRDRATGYRGVNAPGVGAAGSLVLKIHTVPDRCPARW